jgi:hypothetical protein
MKMIAPEISSCPARRLAHVESIEAVIGESLQPDRNAQGRYRMFIVALTRENVPVADIFIDGTDSTRHDSRNFLSFILGGRLISAPLPERGADGWFSTNLKGGESPRRFARRLPTSASMVFSRMPIAPHGRWRSVDDMTNSTSCR